MKREIKFRGLRIDGGGWVYGMPTYNFRYIFNEEQLDSPDNYEVFPETVGQFTGLLDKNGAEIYEGDIVSYSDKTVFLDVAFIGGSFVLNREGKTYVYNINPKMLEIIGNIHKKKETKWKH